MLNSLLEEIEAAALQLAPTERARLAERLLASLEEDDEILAAWVEEAERRADAFDRGEMEAVDADEAIAQARARVSGRPAACRSSCCGRPKPNSTTRQITTPNMPAPASPKPILTTSSMPASAWRSTRKSALGYRSTSAFCHCDTSLAPSFIGFPPRPSSSRPSPTSAAGLDIGRGGADRTPYPTRLFKLTPAGSPASSTLTS